jgi:4-carboxymuconolactone decarboxylase
MTEYAAGVRRLSEIDPDKPAQLESALDSVAPGLGKSLLAFTYGDIWCRPGLGLRERELIALVAMAPQGLTADLASHVHNALRLGWSQDEIVEIIVSLIPLTGFARAISAANAAKAAFIEDSVAVAPEDA